MNTCRMFCAVAVTLSVARLDSAAAPSASPDFTREVRPILSRNCFKCHGPDDAARKSKLRLDVREQALQPAKSGAVAIVPGNVEKSELVKRIFSADADEVMPPPSTKTQLTSSEKEILKRWIAAGAEYQEHWAFVRPKKAALPTVKQSSWPRNEIDYFVLARLEQADLKPSPPADRYTLARRVSLDLIGLPPAPEEADEFVNDSSPDAFEKFTDRLLASPQYGERWARRWMDLARYADTNGYEKDRQRSIWPWRDWVIKALNADMPFDQFTVEQIAGDLLPNATRDQIIATGFHRNTMLNEEGGIDPLEFRFHAMTDRVGTTAATWLGLTLQCAQCHTHKYDPIPHREYYQVMAFLNNADEPDFDLPDDALAEKQRANLEKAAKLLAEMPGQFPIETNIWQTPKPLSVETASGQKPKLLDDGSALFAEESPDRDTYTVTLETDLPEVRVLRLEALIDEKLPSKGPGRVKHGNFVLSEITVTAAPKDAPEQMRPVKLIAAQADAEQKEFPVANAFDGKTDTGWAVDEEGKKLNAPHRAIFTFDQPVSFALGTRFVVKLDQQHGQRHTIGRVRLSVGVPAADQRPLEVRRAEELEKQFAAWLTHERGRTVKWTPLRPTEAKSNLPLLTVQPDDSVFASGDMTKSDTYELKFRTGARGITALRLEALPDERLPMHGPGMTYYEGPKGDFFLGELQLSVDGQAVKFSRATESYARNAMGANNPVSAALAIDGDPQTGWSTNGREGERHEAVFTLAEPLAQASELNLKLQFGRHYACSLGRLRISVTTDARGVEARDLPDWVEPLLLLPDSDLTAAQRERLREQFLLTLPELASAREAIEKLRKPSTPPTTLVMRERPAENPRPTFIHRRGEFLQPTERVEPGVLSAVAPFPANWPRNRLGFARWLVATNNPLTARVTVNRQWQAFFGRGLVRTTEDFGFQGEPPSNPELLDWLAVEFMKQGWSLKRLHKLIVMSATYQQSSRATPELLAKDSENRLLARGPHVRLEAELIRDAALLASGLLSTKMGGPSVYPPQPEGVTEVAYGGAKWTPSEGEDRYRRSVYTFMKRTAPFAMFNTFDGPTGESCVARRDISNTPQQALTILNDVLFVEVSQALGRKLAAREGSIEEKIRDGFRRCLTRTPTDEEVAALAKFFALQKQRCLASELDAIAVAGDGSGDLTERAAWTALARALLNLDEMITKG
ncbi:MAG: PSD1 domain-containing protein [Verrucomicrobia bacterium]|nr:PSD1 domain-containing protein [Verrucomicrobiota bacterium]